MKSQEFRLDEDMKTIFSAIFLIHWTITKAITKNNTVFTL